MGFETPITIRKAINEIQSNKYVLPAIQREFVWSAEQIENLFDSLMKGYPIGSFLFWKVQPPKIGEFQFYRFMDHYHERDYQHNEPLNPPDSHEITAILDGQQRLTALYIGLLGWYADKLPYYRWNNDKAFPKRELYINLKRPQETVREEPNGYEIRFLRAEDLKNQSVSKFWFKVGNILRFTKLNEVFNFCVKNGLIDSQDQDTYPSDTLTGLWEVMTQNSIINYFLEEEQNLDKVLNIFIRVNSGGTTLSYSDMLLSIATAQWHERDARQEIYDLVDELNNAGDGFVFNKDYVLKASLILTDIVGIEFRVNNFNKANMATIEKNWDAIAESLRLTIHAISSWGYNRQTLPSAYATIPLAYYLYHKGNPHGFVISSNYARSREAAQHWLRIALLKRTFSGTPDNVLRQIRRAMSDAIDSADFPAGAILDALAPTNRSMSFTQAELDGLLSLRYTQPHTFTVLTMFYPWLKYDQQFHIDHIFPKTKFSKSQLRKRGIPEDKWSLWLDQVDNIANLQLLQGPVNMSKSDKEFEAWLMGEFPTPPALAQYREHHLIPDMTLSFENFPDFLEARSKMMRRRLANLLNVQLQPDGWAN